MAGTTSIVLIRRWWKCVRDHPRWRTLVCYFENKSVSLRWALAVPPCLPRAVTIVNELESP